jgi:hypothetical protein
MYCCSGVFPERSELAVAGYPLEATQVTPYQQLTQTISADVIGG